MSNSSDDSSDVGRHAFLCSERAPVAALLQKKSLSPPMSPLSSVSSDGKGGSGVGTALRQFSNTKGFGGVGGSDSDDSDHDDGEQADASSAAPTNATEEVATFQSIPMTMFHSSGPLRSRDLLEAEDRAIDFGPISWTEGAVQRSEKPIGVVKHVKDDVIVVAKGDEAPILDIASVLCNKEGEVLGRLTTLFGPVVHCFYTVKMCMKGQGGEASVNIGDPVYSVLNAQVVIATEEDLQQACARGGTDASQINDEEKVVPDFSDDDKEAHWKRDRKQRRREGAQLVGGGDDEDLSDVSLKSEVEFDEEGNVVKLVPKKRERSVSPPQRVQREVTGGTHRGGRGRGRGGLSTHYNPSSGYRREEPPRVGPPPTRTPPPGRGSDDNPYARPLPPPPPMYYPQHPTPQPMSMGSSPYGFTPYMPYYANAYPQPSALPPHGVPPYFLPNPYSYLYRPPT